MSCLNSTSVLLTLSARLLCLGDALRNAGDRPCRLAEEHHLQALRSDQQANLLVLAGRYCALLIYNYTEAYVLKQ